MLADPHRQERSPCAGWFVAAVSVRPSRSIEDVNDAERLRHDPAMRWIVGGKAARACGFAEPDGPLRNAMARGTCEFLRSCRLVRPLDRSCARPPSGEGIVLDMDSSVSPTHGEQEKSVWNGHYACTCYHPLFVFNQFGDLERSALRPGNVHSADGWDAVLKPVVARYQGKVSRIYFRADAALRCQGSTSSWRRSGSNTRSGFRPTRFCRIKIGYLLKRPVGRPRTMCVGSMPISPIRREAGPSRAESSPKSSGIPASFSARWLHRYEPARPAKNVVAFYNQRGTASSGSRRAKARSNGRGSLSHVRRKCCPASASCAGLQSRKLPANARDAEPIEDWSLTSLREKLIKIGAKVVSHGRYVAFQMAEVAIPRQMFQEILRLIAELRPQPPPAPA